MSEQFLYTDNEGMYTEGIIEGNSLQRTCDAGAVVGDFVVQGFLNANSVDVVTSNIDKRTVIGIIVEKPTVTDAIVMTKGVISGLAGMIKSQKVYLGADGKMTPVIPTNGYLHVLGHAIDEDKVDFYPINTKVKIFEEIPPTPPDFLMTVDIGSEGTYDIERIYAPSVIKESDTSYKMWYSGREGGHYRIIYCTSTDGLNWTNFQMVVDFGSEGTYDTYHAFTPHVIKESDTSYKMWYTGHTPSNARILYCTSTNGINWTNFQLVVDMGSEGTYDTHRTYSPSVIKESDTSYKMWYDGFDNDKYRIIYCTSTDGINWTNFQMVVDVGLEGTYDTIHVYSPSVIKESDTSYKMWYDGTDGQRYRILYCTSTDGINWTNFQMVVDVGSEGTYDTWRTHMPHVMKESSNSYKMWYTGYSDKFVTIYAGSSDGINWGV